jgi:CheY-like chemotaxis protein
MTTSPVEGDDFIFTEDDAAGDAEIADNTWKMLIVDDVEDIHNVTRLIFEAYSFENKCLNLMSAYSGEEAKKRMSEQNDIAVILLDVVMETDHAGLDVVRYIREELKNKTVRIILRTGQPGQAPEKKVIVEYDINDYKTKEELTSNKLFTAVTSALRSYRDLSVIEKNRKGLEMIIDASSSLLQLHSLKQFAAGVLTQLTAILGFEENSLLLQKSSKSCGFAATQAEHGNKYVIMAATGQYEAYLDRCITDLNNDDIMQDIHQALKQKKSVFTDKNVICYFKTNNNIENLLYLQSQKNLNFVKNIKPCLRPTKLKNSQ